MSVFRETTIDWGGETYVIVPSNRLLRRIEREVPLVRFVAECMQDYRVADVAFILSEFIKEAGGSINPDELTAELFEDLYTNKAEGYLRIASQLCDAIVPPSAIKNLKAPSEKKSEKEGRG